VRPRFEQSNLHLLTVPPRRQPQQQPAGRQQLETCARSAATSTAATSSRSISARTADGERRQRAGGEHRARSGISASGRCTSWTRTARAADVQHADHRFSAKTPPSAREHHDRGMAPRARGMDGCPHHESPRRAPAPDAARAGARTRARTENVIASPPRSSRAACHQAR
jgi:hypothetical protein